MSPSPKTPARGAAAPASHDFAEAFVRQPEGAEAARAESAALGVDCVSTGTAAALTFLAATLKARSVVEIGTGTGVASLALLAGMAPDGVLTSIDAETDLQLRARHALAAIGVPTRRARLIAGQALEVLPKLTDGAYDLVFIDGDPLEFVEYVAQAGRLLRSGGVLVLNHALWQGQVADSADDDDEPLIIRESLEAVRSDEAFTPALLPVGDGLLVAVRS